MAAIFEWRTRRGESRSLKWLLKKAKGNDARNFDFSSTGVRTLACRFEYECYVT